MHLQGKRADTSNASLVLSLLEKNIAKLRRSTPRKKVLADALFCLAHFAFISGIDLEALLRQKVLKEAEAVSYQHRQR